MKVPFSTRSSLFVGMASLGLLQTAFAGADLPRRNTHVSRMDGYAADVEASVKRITSGRAEAGTLHSQVQAWARDASAFVTALDLAVNGMNTSAATSFDDIRNDVFNTRSRLALDLTRLRMRHEALRSQIATEKNKLGALEKADHSALLYTQGASAAESVAARGVKSLDTLDATLVALFDRVVVTWDPAWRKSQIALETWLSTNKVPEWQVRVDGLNAWFAALEALRGSLVPVDAQVEVVKARVSQGRPYAAKRASEVAERLCLEAHARMASDAVLAPVSALATRHLEDACSAAKARLAVQWGNPVLIPGNVYLFAKGRALLAKQDCANAGTALDCATAAWLARVPKATVLAMTPGELALYEDAWSKATGLREGTLP